MLIFFDIDGTLISEKTHLMTESTREAIQLARAGGHICMINTGRTGKLVGPDVTGHTEFDGLLMGCGTMITYREKILLHQTFSREMARDIIEGLRRHRIDAVLEGSQDNFRDSDDRIFSRTFLEYIHYFDYLEYKSYEEAPGNFDKFYAHADVAAYMDAFREEFSDRLDFVDRKKGYYEIMPKGYSKASAMRFVSKVLNIPMSETVAIGDSSNDIAMLECAGIAVAMGNATEDVKSLADHVTTDVEDDGIRNALRWLGAIE